MLYKHGCAGDVEGDFWLSLELLRSSKDHSEFTLVRDWVRNALQVSCLSGFFWFPKSPMLPGELPQRQGAASNAWSRLYPYPECGDLTVLALVDLLRLKCQGGCCGDTCARQLDRYVARPSCKAWCHAGRVCLQSWHGWAEGKGTAKVLQQMNSSQAGQAGGDRQAVNPAVLNFTGSSVQQSPNSQQPAAFAKPFGG